MKKINTCCALIGAATLISTPNLLAVVYYPDTGTIVLERAYGNANGGGAFQAVTSGLGTFDTFCLDSQVEFTDGQTYNYMASDSAIPGGPGNGGAPVPITIGTAYLMNQFTQNAPGFFGTPQIAIDMQNAVWWLQGQQFGVDNYLVTDAENALGLNNSTITDAADGAYGVIALDLTDANGGAAQPQLAEPQLAIVPEPTTLIAGAMLLLPFTVSAVRIMRRHQTA